MTTEPIIQQMDEAIAAFMSLETRFVKYPDSALNGIEVWINGHSVRMQYHSSWDWLMPVWFKCQDIGADLGRAFEKFHNAFHAGIDLKEIGKCHNAVYQFIKWYNKRKEVTNE